jgi:hypothetical protein
LTLFSNKGIDEATHVGHEVRHGVAERRGERAKRQRPRGFGADDPFRAVAGGFGMRQYLAREPGLAHARGSNDHHAGVLATSAERTANGGQFAVSSSQRFAADHARNIACARPADGRNQRLLTCLPAIACRKGSLRAGLYLRKYLCGRGGTGVAHSYVIALAIAMWPSKPSDVANLR